MRKDALMIRQKSHGKYRKHKAYGLVGCLAVAIFTAGLSETVQAAVVDSGNDIREVDVHHPDNSGVAMTYTRFDNGTSKQTASGSGVFIAPNVMITVAHNYLDKNKETDEGFVRGGDSAQSYVVTNSNTEKRAGNPSSGEDQIVNKGDIHYYNKAELGKSYTNDLAVVVTEKPVEAMTRGEDGARHIGTANQGDTIHMVGYPNDFSSRNLSADARNKLKDGKLYTVSGIVSELNKTTGEGKYHMSALGGFSGGPIFNDKGDVVGIHQHGTNSDEVPEAQQYGAGLFFTEKHKAWIKEMVDQYAIKGWYVNGNEKYYYDDNHQSVRNVERDIDGARYRFDERGRGTLISGKEIGRVVLKAVNKQGDTLFERVVGQGSVGDGFVYNFKLDKNNQAYFVENPNATIVSVDGEIINKKFNEKWDKEFASKYQLGNTIIKTVIDGGQKFTRTVSGSVNTGGSGVKPLVADDNVKAVLNGEKNFDATVALTSEAGLGSGTLINDDTIVTVAHNFVHLNTKTNPISVVDNVNKSGDIHLATLPNGKQVRFSNDDIHFWNREGYVQGFKNDLAVIKLRNKFTGESGAKLHDTIQPLKDGDTVHVFGFPKGQLRPILNGKVERVENYGANIMGVAYQGSAPGMSGGGLYNAQGELIGVHQNGVEGMRSGGIAFSKEQLDWIKAVVNGENTSPVYLKDEPRDDDKDKKSDHGIEKPIGGSFDGEGNIITPPTVEIPKYDKPIGGSLDGEGNIITPPTIEIPEYDKPVGGSLDSEGNIITPPTFEIPENDKPIGGSLDGEGNIVTPPTVEIPEYTGHIGGSLDGGGNVVTPPTVEIPKYDKPIGGSLDGEGNVVTPPTVEIPNYDKPIGGSLDGEGNVVTPPTVEILEYTGTIDGLGGQPSRDFNGKSGFPETYEIHDFTGGANPSDAPVNKVPEFTGGVNSLDAPVNNVPEFTGGVNPYNAPVHEVPEFVGSVNPDNASLHDVPEFTGGFNPDNAPVHDVPEFTGGVNPDNAPVHEVPEFVGSVNPDNASLHDVPEFTGGFNPDNAPVHDVPEFTGGVNPDNAPVHDVPEFVGSVNPDKASVHDVPEFIGGAGVDDNRTRDVDIPTQGQQKSLPNTNDAESLLALGSALTMIGLAMRRKYGE